MKKIKLICLALFGATMMQAASYVQLTTISQLQAGDTVILVYKADSVANGTKTTYFDKVKVEILNDTVVSSNSNNLIIGGSSNQWTLTTSGGSKVGHKATTLDMSDTGTTFQISFNDSNAVIKSNTKCTKSGKEGYPSVFYNKQARRFAFYTSTTMAPIQLFKKLPEGQGAAVKVKGVTLSPNSLSLRAGNSSTLTATVAPQDAKNKNVTWGSVDETIATIANGTITAVAKGATKVWVRTEDGDFTDTCVVTIKESASLPNVTWNILQTADSLKEGVKVLFGNAAKDYVMGLYDYDVANSNIRGAAATYGEQRHTVTASESNAYIVHRDGDRIYFEDIDGRYLYMYNTNKNLSASTTINNQAKWTVTYNKDTAVIKSVYSSLFTIYFNKTAANPMYCTYSNYDANHARVLLYSNNAPEWQAPVLHPELHILLDKDTIVDKLDFGDVVYDDGWGTEVNPYEASKTLTFSTKDLTDSIYLLLSKQQAFQLYTAALPAKGGTASVQFSTNKNGNYTDTLYITCDTIVRKIVLTAKAVTEEEVKPSLTLSTKSITMHINLQEEYMADAEMTFSVKNLKKNLYIKWEKGTIPSAAGESATILVGNDAVEIPFGGAPSFGTETRTDEDILFEATAYTEGSYTSTLCFYTPDEVDKSKNAFEERVNITIVADYNPSTSLNSTIVPAASYVKIIKNNHLYILRDGVEYTILGNK